MVIIINARTFLRCYFLLIYSAIFWPERVRNPFSQIFPQDWPYLEKRTPKHLKTHNYLSINLKWRLVKFWPWPRFSRYFCAFALKALQAKLVTFVLVTVPLFLFIFLLFPLYTISCVKSEAGYAREAWKESREENGDAAGFQRTVMADSTTIRKTITPYQEGRCLFSYSV